MIGKAFLNPLGLFVPLAPLMENNIDNFIMFTYVLRWGRHKFVNGFAE